jgi:hypothetical protein
MSEEELLRMEAELASDLRLSRADSKALIAFVRRLQGLLIEAKEFMVNLGRFNEEQAGRLGTMTQDRDILQARVAELLQQERDRDEALAGRQPLPEEKK